MEFNWSMAIDLWILVSIFSLCSNSLALGAESPTVKIKNGTLEGTIMKSRRGREFVAFRGIPYAQPPIGELRFKPPKPFDSWNGVRSAKEDANICPQRDILGNPENIIGVEDCLYLNVYSPKLPSNENELLRTNYPVMIWIHGGGWLMGSSHSAFYGPKFLLDHEIVLVTINYRLGPLGFLSTEDLVAPGNQGLKDQVQSIRWVNENIAAFGGDPNRVTIFGESAGAASVHYHMISPLSRGLFHRAISQSGTIHCPWTLSRPGIARNHADKLGKLLDCPTDESNALVECLRKKEPADLISTDREFQVFDTCPLIPFRPVIESDHPGAFLKEEPAQSLKSGNVADVPWITGTNSHEGSFKAFSIFETKDKGYDKILEEKFMELAPISLLYEDTCPKEFKDNVTKSIRKFYLGDKKIDESTRTNVIDLYTDAWFYIAADNAVRDHLEALSSPVYYYYFAYRGSGSLSSVLAETQDAEMQDADMQDAEMQDAEMQDAEMQDAEKDYGVSHGDELQYIFPIGELIGNSLMTKEDLKMVDVMTHFWVNFAKTGNPTPDKTMETPVKWKPVRTSNVEYLHIGGSNDLGMAADLFPDRINFWASIPYRAKIQFHDDAQRAKDEL